MLNLKIMKKAIYIFILSVFIASCTTKTQFHEVTINNQYTISIPDYLQPCADIHPDASLQYQNIEMDIYAIVIDEKKETMENYDLDYDIETYYKTIALQPFSEKIQNGKISPPGTQTINGHKALTADISGKIDNNDVFYRLALIETTNAFYQLLIWTRADNKEKYMNDFNQTIESFKEILPPSQYKPSKLSDSVTIKTVFDK